MLFSFFFGKSEVWWRQNFFLSFPTEELLLFFICFFFFFNQFNILGVFFPHDLFIVFLSYRTRNTTLATPPPQIWFLWYSDTRLFWDSSIPPLNKSMLMLSESLWEGRFSPREHWDHAWLRQAPLKVQHMLGSGGLLQLFPQTETQDF